MRRMKSAGRNAQSLPLPRVGQQCRHLVGNLRVELAGIGRVHALMVVQFLGRCPFRHRRLARDLDVVLNWLSPTLTRVENACVAGPIMLALARRPRGAVV